MNGFLRSAFIVAAISTIPVTYRYAKETVDYCSYYFGDDCRDNFVYAAGSLSLTLFFLGGAMSNTPKKRILLKDEAESGTYEELER
tara:strand:+ start:8 stop:265 length:258 start_codon:yes stop_codon:yes gene_type:complete